MDKRGIGAKPVSGQAGNGESIKPKSPKLGSAGLTRPRRTARCGFIESRFLSPMPPPAYSPATLKLGVQALFEDHRGDLRVTRNGRRGQAVQWGLLTIPTWPLRRKKT